MQKTQISLIGMPVDLGQGRRGVDMGPSAVRYANLHTALEELNYEIEDLGDIAVPHSENTEVGNSRLKYLKELVKVNQVLADQVSAVVQQQRFPLVIGGDHSLAIGSIAGAAQHYKRLGVIWYDAHGDLNTDETTPSGNIHGMPLAVNLGVGHPDLIGISGYHPKIQPENVVLIGIRKLDESEKDLIRELGLRVFTMHEIDRLGMARVMEEAIQIASRGTDGVHLSFDLDGLDPNDAPGVGTPVPGGISYRETHLAMEMLAEAGMVTSADFVEINPILDRSNVTAQLAVDFIQSLFGKKIL